jgi:hypothetical protein
MISRYFGAKQGLVIAVLSASVMVSTAAWAAERGPGPSYTYFGVAYEWTDVKYGLNPSVDERFNNGKFEGANIDLSLGILPWMFVAVEVFDGDCHNCATDINTNPVDQDFSSYKAGLGVNIGFDKFGLNDRTDLVLRGNYIDVDKLEFTTPGSTQPSLDGSGWSAEAQIRSQISPRTEFQVGYEYEQFQYSGAPDIKNSDVTIGLNYRLGWGVALLAKGIIFDNDSGFQLGVRWYFSDLYGRDSFIK